MSKPNQEGEKHLKLDNIQFPFHPKPKTKRFSPITPQNNLKNFFPEDFFGDSSKKPIFENVDITGLSGRKLVVFEKLYLGRNINRINK